MHSSAPAQVVIGAHFGDEGKGRVIDHYATAAGTDGLVVRFNGGAQAGHTVVAPDGRRHVFSHIGSGALAGAATFLSRFFVANPILFLKEWDVLLAKDVLPVVHIDPRSPVTTPYDMMINQLIEAARGAGRHGSCGIGFGETLERHLTPAHALTVADLAERTTLVARLDAIRRAYVPARLAQLGIGAAYDRNRALFQSAAILEHFVEDTERFRAKVQVSTWPAAAQGRHLLFEGAQGLLLDQERGFFPHVTRSHTGLRNVLALAAELALERLEVTYVSRSYLTRHGAGPLPHALPKQPYAGIVDDTNVPNPYQGTLRFAWLDLDLCGRAIAADRADAQAWPGIALDTRLALTCLDQVDGEATYILEGVQRRGSQDALVAAAAAAAGANTVLLGFGAGRADLCPAGSGAVRTRSRRVAVSGSRFA